MVLSPAFLLSFCCIWRNMCTGRFLLIISLMKDVENQDFPKYVWSFSFQYWKRTLPCGSDLIKSIWTRKRQKSWNICIIIIAAVMGYENSFQCWDIHCFRWAEQFLQCQSFCFSQAAGLSVIGRFCVATEKTVFSMPECAIGRAPLIASIETLVKIWLILILQWCLKLLCQCLFYMLVVSSFDDYSIDI